MPNTIDGQYILYVLLIFSFLSDIFPEKLAFFTTYPLRVFVITI